MSHPPRHRSGKSPINKAKSASSSTDSATKPAWQAPPQTAKKAGKKAGHSGGRIRIIAGELRGRLIKVPLVEGLRPTGDRVRETLFNWLQVPVNGAHCLDLFAGSGALGLEALSRRAGSVVFVEPDLVARQAILDTCRSFNLSVSEVSATGYSLPDPAGLVLFAGKAEQWIGLQNDSKLQNRFDIVFIDPPFQHHTQWQTLAALAPSSLSDDALVYVESPSSQAMPDQLPTGFSIVKEKQFGDVHARLLRYCIA